MRGWIRTTGAALLRSKSFINCRFLDSTLKAGSRPSAGRDDHESALDEFAHHGQAFAPDGIERSVGYGRKFLDRLVGGAGAVAGGQELRYQRLQCQMEREAAD